ncbi:MAG: DNA mismatch repair endonuclease MutL [Clostridiales bacterium]|jgi:DNA mismatch repair protein MutL|nr:DNA mismatch repair endonuclease MutL [Clostridiales bacterium]
MAKIFEMSQHMADLIAAGEVVERPASVVKELCENAIDAGAGALTVEIKNGGMTYIRVTDDGCGIGPEDVTTAFLRHATSKLRKEEELSSIKTLGFRGEALAAIAAVSRIEMFTREKGASEGTFISLEGGTVTEKSPAGCPEGTTIIVRDLFFNTPARLKFMKKDAAEGAAVSAAVLRCALSHPELSVRYIRDGREEFHTPGDGRTDSCIYSVLGREFSSSMLEARASGDGISIEGYICSPDSARGNRGHQFFFVNGRFVKSQLLQAALEQAYRNRIFSGRFPSCVLYITLNPAAVDVNVHPAKTEIKFMNERQVFDAVHYAAKAALDGENRLNRIEKSSPPSPSQAVPPRPVDTAARDSSTSPVKEKDEMPYNRGVDFVTSIQPPPENKEPSLTGVFEQTRIVYGVSETTMPQPVGKAPLKSEPEQEPAPYRIIGEAMSLYIIVERGESLFLIDKHAAHERLLFDRLKSREEGAMSQALMTPLIAAVGREEAAELLAHKELLFEMGFELEDFGAGAVAVNSAPAGIEVSDITALLTEICEDIRLGMKPGSLGVRDEILASIACKAAIKAGKSSEPAEHLPVVSAVMSGEVKYCPHGRPVSVELTKKSLDKSFKRI